MHPSFRKEEKVLENYEAVLNIYPSTSSDVIVESKCKAVKNDISLAFSVIFYSFIYWRFFLFSFP